MYCFYDLWQVTKDYGPERVSGPLTYNDISASPEGRRHIWTDRERDWEEAEALDTGQERPDILYRMVIGCARAKGRGRSLLLHLSSHPMVSPDIWHFVLSVFSVA